MSAAEDYVNPDSQLASYRLWVQHETGRIALAFSEEELKYKAALLARITHPNPASVPEPNSDRLNALAELRKEFMERSVDADLQLLWRGIPKDFLELVYLNEEHEPAAPVLALVEQEQVTITEAPQAAVQETVEIPYPRLALVL